MADTFDIITQRQAYGIGPDGIPTDIMAVTFRTKPSGIVATEEVPVSSYTPESVNAAIAKRVVALEGVHTL